MAHTFLAEVLARPAGRDEVFRALENNPTWVALSNGAVLPIDRPLPFRAGVHVVPGTCRIDGRVGRVLLEIDTDVRSGSAVRRIYVADGPFWGEVTTRATDVVLPHAIGETRLADFPSTVHVGPEGRLEDDPPAPLAARTVFEAHLYMAVRGYPDPMHALRNDAGDLVSTYAGDDGRQFRFALSDPSVKTRFGPGVSAILSVDTLVRHAERLARIGTRSALEDASATLEQAQALSTTDRRSAVLEVWRGILGPPG